MAHNKTREMSSTGRGSVDGAHRPAIRGRGRPTREEPTSSLRPATPGAKGIERGALSICL